MSESHVKLGALLAVMAEYQDIGKQAANLALEIIQHDSQQKPVIMSPRKIELYINKRMANLLDIYIPTHIFSQADKVFN